MWYKTAKTIIIKTTNKQNIFKYSKEQMLSDTYFKQIQVKNYKITYFLRVLLSII